MFSVIIILSPQVTYPSSHFSARLNASWCHVTGSDMAASRRRLLCLRSGMWSLLFYGVYAHLKLVLAEEVDSCEDLKLGQYPLIVVSRRDSQLKDGNLPEGAR